MRKTSKMVIFGEKDRVLPPQKIFSESKSPEVSEKNFKYPSNTHSWSSLDGTTSNRHRGQNGLAFGNWSKKNNDINGLNISNI